MNYKPDLSDSRIYGLITALTITPCTYTTHRDFHFCPDMNWFVANQLISKEVMGILAGHSPRSRQSMELSERWNEPESNKQIIYQEANPLDKPKN